MFMMWAYTTVQKQYLPPPPEAVLRIHILKNAEVDGDQEKNLNADAD